MSRTIGAIMRHMAPPASHLTNQNDRAAKLEKEITAKKRHYIWAESRFVRTMLPFHSNIRVGYNGTEVDGKSVLNLMTLAPTGRDKGADPYRRTRCGRRNARCRPTVATEV
jgi:hypothetical protein